MLNPKQIQNMNVQKAHVFLVSVGFGFSSLFRISKLAFRIKP